LLASARSLDALDRITEGIFILDAGGRCTFANQTALRLLPRLVGASGELVGRRLWEAPPSFDDTPAGKALRHALVERAAAVHTLRDPVSGDPVELRLYPGADGLSGLLLERPAARSADLLDRVSDLYLACDDEWRLTRVNARAAEYLKLLGTGAGDPVGRSVWEAIPGLAGSRFQAEAFRAGVEHAEVELVGFFAPR
jgi:PAS domain-containing protein